MANKLANITLLVAQCCNLRCRYCYAGGGDYGMPTQRMTATTLRRSLEQLLPLAGPRLTLSFFGGEPLLNLPLLQRAVILAQRLGEKAGTDIRFALTTNGTLLEGRALEFVRRHVNSLAVSLDGNAAVNDGTRRFRLGNGSVHAKVVIGLARLRATGASFSLRATVTPETAPFLAESAEYLAGLGAVSLRIVPDFGATTWPENALEALVNGFEAVHRVALTRALNGHSPLGGEALYPILENRLHGIIRTRPCMAGEEVVAVAANGDLYPCDHFVGRAEYAMGNVYDPDFPGPAFTRVQERLAANTTAVRPVCQECTVRDICGGECPAVATEDTATPDATFCCFKHETTRRLLLLLEQASLAGELPTALRQLVEIKK